MTKPVEIAARRAEMIEHLEAARALADKTADAVAGYMIERAIDALRVLAWQENSELPRDAVPSGRAADVGYRG